MSDTSSEALYLDNLEISHPRDILDLETPIKTPKQSTFDNEIDFHNSLWQQFNDQTSADQFIEGEEQSVDSVQNDDYIVTSLDDFQPMEKEDNQHLAYGLDNWTHYQNEDSIFATNPTDIMFESPTHQMSESDYQSLSRLSNNC